MRRVFRPSQLIQLPKTPGVYYFHDREDTILYVGKATSLKARVGSYWNRPLDDRLTRMIPRIVTIRIQPTDTALEAFILEANEIQRLNPPVNVRGKDSKTFAQIALTKEDYPRLLITRPTQKLTVPIERTFGPYVSGSSARLALKALRSIFKFNCGALQRGVTPKLTVGRAKGDKGIPHSGRPCLYYQLGQCPGVCMGTITQAEYKRQIRKVVQFLEGKKARIIASTRRQMEVSARARHYEQAARLRDELFALEHIRDTAFMTDDSTEFLGTAFPSRLEAYDISNIGATAAVASMVVLEYGRPSPSQYRQFKIRCVSVQNDIAMLREVLSRRFRHSEWPDPNFILIDGGVAQRNVVLQLLRKLRKQIPVAGVVKGPDRKLARLVPSDLALQWLNDHRLTNQLFEPVVRLARDEAHRFAIKYHRVVRARRASK